MVEAQHQVNAKPSEEIESIGLMKFSLQSCLKLLRDERVILEIQNLINRCKQPIPMSATYKEVHHIKKYV